MRFYYHKFIYTLVLSYVRMTCTLSFAQTHTHSRIPDRWQNKRLNFEHDKQACEQTCWVYSHSRRCELVYEFAVRLFTSLHPYNFAYRLAFHIVWTHSAYDFWFLFTLRKRLKGKRIQTCTIYSTIQISRALPSLFKCQIRYDNRELTIASLKPKRLSSI